MLRQAGDSSLPAAINDPAASASVAMSSELAANEQGALPSKNTHHKLMVNGWEREREREKRKDGYIRRSR